MRDDTHTKKRKIAPARGVITGLGCLMMLAMLAAGAVIGGLGVLIAGPEINGQNAVSTAFAQTASALNAQQTSLAQTSDANNAAAFALNETQQALSRSGTQAALNALSTGVALDNQAALLQQTATQSARYSSATRTAQALSSARQMTQVAQDYAATQAALQAIATQVELDFRATQDALNQNATQVNSLPGDAIVAQSAQAPPVTLPAQNAPRVTFTPSPTFLPPPTNTPDAAPIIALRTDFGAVHGIVDYVFDDLNWRSDAGALFAMRDAAYIETRDTFADYTLDVEITPSSVAAEYVLLLDADSDTPLFVRVLSDGQYLTQALWTQGEESDGVDLDVQLPGRLSLTVETREGLELFINGQSALVLRRTLNVDGTIAVQLPAGAQLNGLRVQQEPS